MSLSIVQLLYAYLLAGVIVNYLFDKAVDATQLYDCRLSWWERGLMLTTWPIGVCIILWHFFRELFKA